MFHSVRKLKSLLFFNVCYRLGVSHLPYPPLLINLEPTNHCNLRCPMCPVSVNYPTVERGLMEMNLFERIVKEIAPFRPEVALNLGGESAIHPELVRMVRELKRAGMYVFLDTNATRLTPSMSEGLLDAGIDKLVFCLDGNTPESYEAMRVRGRFEETVDNIRYFLRLKRERNQRATYTVIKNIQYYDPHTEAAFPKNFAQLFDACPPDEYRFTWADYWPGSHRRQLRKQYAVQPFAEQYIPCINLWKKLPISWDGMIYICCLDLNRTSPIGSVQEMGVLGTWNAPAMKEFRRRHARQEQAQLSLCQNCNQIRRHPEKALAGLLDAGGDRFTPWVREEKLVQIGPAVVTTGVQLGQARREPSGEQ
jgi:wyosine [tRNA(Phe)-imidazoG37] synthetase (radical SAM superfamily)